MSSQVLYFTWFFTHNIISNKFNQHCMKSVDGPHAGRGLDSTDVEPYWHCDTHVKVKHKEKWLIY